MKIRGTESNRKVPSILHPHLPPVPVPCRLSCPALPCPASIHFVDADAVQVHDMFIRIRIYSTPAVDTLTPLATCGTDRRPWERSLGPWERSPKILHHPSSSFVRLTSRALGTFKFYQYNAVLLCRLPPPQKSSKPPREFSTSSLG